MNKVILMGRLTKDPEARYSDKKAIAKYTLAVDRIGKDAGTDFINVVAFGNSGEFAEKYFRKGTKILLTGRIQTGSYTNKDGKTVYTTDVIAESQEFCEKKDANENKDESSIQSFPVDNGFDGFSSVCDDSELPFAPITR